MSFVAAYIFLEGAKESAVPSLFPLPSSEESFSFPRIGNGRRGDLEILQRRQTVMSSLSFVT